MADVARATLLLVPLAFTYTIRGSLALAKLGLRHAVGLHFASSPEFTSCSIPRMCGGCGNIACIGLLARGVGSAGINPCMSHKCMVHALRAQRLYFRVPATSAFMVGYVPVSCVAFWSAPASRFDWPPSPHLSPLAALLQCCLRDREREDSVLAGSTPRVLELVAACCFNGWTVRLSKSIHAWSKLIFTFVYAAWIRNGMKVAVTILTLPSACAVVGT